ncbi:microtubule-associated protein futsch [Microplitis mediator]|uniref:microtubule-associated protein futsch n=1 Tax=Microplitis mediator TaxID=375433 RepID=UPI0025530598|nr:microtubule-associated protein futsch [Microplitis mediator]
MDSFRKTSECEEELSMINQTRNDIAATTVDTANIVSMTPGPHQHPPPSPLSGCYLLVVLPEPHAAQHKHFILNRLTEGFLSWDKENCHVDLEKELEALVTQSPEGEEAKNGERLIQYATENLVTEILIHPQTNTLLQCIRNLLASFTKHRHIIHAGYTFGENGSWILQDGTFSLADFLDAFNEHDVQRVLRAYENNVTIDINCAGIGEWSTERLSQEPCTRLCRIRLNPDNILTTGIPAIVNFINYIEQYLVAQTLDQLMQPSDVVGNIRFSHPTLYVFPGGQGDAALFGINGFNMLVDGGFARKSCFWDFTRHLDRLDAVLFTRLNNSNIGGMSSVLRKKKETQVYPQIGHFFGNLIERKHSNFPDDNKDRDPLIISLIDLGQEMVNNLKHINLRPHLCYRNQEPINLYHKVGHGTLDMYILSPLKDSTEVKEFLSKWNAVDQKLFADSHKKDSNNFTFPIQNMVSICALLIWQPANPDDSITRILFPGSTPQHKIFEGIDRLKHLEFLKYPTCSAKNLSPAVSLATLKEKSTKLKINQIDKETKRTNEIKNPKRELSEVKALKLDNQAQKYETKAKKTSDLENKKIDDTKEYSKTVIDIKESKKNEKNIKDLKKDSKKDVNKEAEIIKTNVEDKNTMNKELKGKIERKKHDSKDSKESKITPQVLKAENKSDSTNKKLKISTLKKPLSGLTTKSEISKSPAPKTSNKLTTKQVFPPAKSAKDANNRKVLEQKNIEKISSKQKASPTVAPVEKKSVVRRTKLIASPSKSRLSGSPVKQSKISSTVSTKSDKDGVVKKIKNEKETTDSSTVSTSSVVEIDPTKFIDKCLTEKSEDMSLDSIENKVLADLKEERQVIEEIEAVLQKAERIENTRENLVKEGHENLEIKEKKEDITEDDVTAEIDEIARKSVSRKASPELTEEDEYLIIEKEEIYTEDSAHSGETEHKHFLDVVQSEKNFVHESLIKEEEAENIILNKENDKEEKEEDDDDDGDGDGDDDDVDVDDDDGDDDDDVDNQDYGDDDENEQEKEEEDGECEEKHGVKEIAEDYESVEKEVAVEKGIVEEQEKSDIPEKKLHDDFQDREKEHQESKSISISKHKEESEEKNKEIITSSTKMIPKKDSKDALDKKDSENITEAIRASPEKVDSSERKVINDTDVKQEIGKDSQIREKFEESQERVSTMESGATTTAPTLPEDERISVEGVKQVPTDIIKQGIAEVKKIEIPAKSRIISLATMEVSELKPGTKVFTSQQTIPALPRDIVKTPDEVADLPVHEEVDPKLYEIDNYDTSKEGKAQYIKESVISSKEPKNVLGFFSKVADKFEKGIDKLTGKSRRDSEKDIDENSLSKSGSPRESNIDEISAGMKIEELQPKQDGKDVAVKETIETSIESKEIHKTEGIPSETDEKSDTPDHQQANKLDENVEGVEDVEALLEEASKKFKTVKDSLRDSLESLEEQIVQEELIKTELECDSNDEIEGKLNKVVEKLEEIKPNEENITTDKEVEKVKFGLSKSDYFEDNERSDDMSSVKNIKEAVKDVGEVLAGTAGIIIEDKPKDVIEIVKKVAEVLKENDFLPDQTLSAEKLTAEIKKDSKTKELWQDHHDQTPVASSSVKSKNDDKLEAKLMCADLLRDDIALNLQTNISALSDTQDTELDVLKVGIESVCKKVDVTHQKDGKELVSDIVTSEIAFEHKIIPTTAEVVLVTPDSLPTSPQFSAKLPDQYVDKSQIEMSSIESFITEDVKNIVNKKIDIYKIIEELLLIHKIKITIQILEFISIEKQIVKQKLIQIINQIVSQHNLLPSSAIENITIFDTEKEILKDVKEQEVEDYITEQYLKNNIPITVMILKEISIKHSYPIYSVIEVIKNIIIINKVPPSDIMDISEQVLEDLVRENTHIKGVEVDEKNQIDDKEKHDIEFTEPTLITDEVKSLIQDHFTNEYIAKNKNIDINAIKRIHHQHLISKRAIMEILDELIISKKLQKQSVVDIAEVAWNTFESSDEIEDISKNIKKDKMITKIESDPLIGSSDKSKYAISFGDLDKSESDDFEAVEQEYKLNISIDKNKIQHDEKECTKSSIDDVMEADEKINMSGQKPENITDKKSDLTSATSSMISSAYGQKIMVESENDNEQELKSSACLESIVMSDKITLPDVGKDLMEDGKSVFPLGHTSIEKQDEVQTDKGEVQDSRDSVLSLSVKSSRKTSLTEPEEKERNDTESLITSTNISPRQAEKSIDLEKGQIQQPLSPAHSVSSDSKDLLEDIKDESKNFALTSSSTAISPTQKKNLEFSEISEVQNIEFPIAPIVSTIDKKMNDQIDNQEDDKKPESSEMFEFSKRFEKKENSSQSSNEFKLSTSLISSEQQRPSDQADDHDNNLKSETLLTSKSLSSATDMIDDIKDKLKDPKTSSTEQLSVVIGRIESVDQNIEDKKNIHETIATSQDSTLIRRESLTDDQVEKKQSDRELAPPKSSVNTKEDILSDETKDQTIKEESRKRSISTLLIDNIDTVDNDQNGLKDKNISSTFQFTELSDKKLSLCQQIITEKEDIETSELLPSSTISQVGISSDKKVTEQSDNEFTIPEKEEKIINAAEDRINKVELGTLSSSTLPSSSVDKADDSHDELKDVKLLPKIQSPILSQETTSVSKHTEDGKNSTETAVISPDTVIQTESLSTNEDEKQRSDNELISPTFSVCGEKDSSPDDVGASETSKKPSLSPSQQSDTDIADSNKDGSKIIEPSPESKSTGPSDQTVKASMHAEEHTDDTESTVSPKDTTSQHETLKDMESRHSMERQSLLSLVSDENDRLINQPDKIDDTEKSKTISLSPSSRSPTNIADSHEDKSKDVKLSPTLPSSVVSDGTVKASMDAEDHRDTIESTVSIPDATTQDKTSTDDKKENEQYDERRSSLSTSVPSRKGSSTYQTDDLGDIEKSETPLLSPSSRSHTSIADSHEDKSEDIKLSPTLPSSAVSDGTVTASMDAEDHRTTIESTVSIPDTTTQDETLTDDKKEKEQNDERRSSLSTSVPRRKGSSTYQTDDLGDIEKSETPLLSPSSRSHTSIADSHEDKSEDIKLSPTLPSSAVSDGTVTASMDAEDHKTTIESTVSIPDATTQDETLTDDKKEKEQNDERRSSLSISVPRRKGSSTYQTDDLGDIEKSETPLLSPSSRSHMSIADSHEDKSEDIKLSPTLPSSAVSDGTVKASMDSEDLRDTIESTMSIPDATTQDKTSTDDKKEKEQYDERRSSLSTSVPSRKGSSTYQTDDLGDIEKSETPLLSSSSRSHTSIADSHEDKSEDIKLSPTLPSSAMSDRTVKASMDSEDHRDTIESTMSIPDATTQDKTSTDDKKEKEQYDERRSSLSTSVPSRKGSSTYQTDDLGDIEKSETPLLSPSSRSHMSIADSHEDKSEDIKLSPTLPSSAVSDGTVKASMDSEDHRDTIESTMSIPDATTQDKTSTDDKKENEQNDERRSSLSTSVPSRKGSLTYQTDVLGDIEKSETPLLSPSSRSHTSITDSHEDKSTDIKLSPTLLSSTVSGETVKASMHTEDRKDTIESTVSISDTTIQDEPSTDGKKQKEQNDERRSSLSTLVPSRKGSSIYQTDDCGGIEKSEIPLLSPSSRSHTSITDSHEDESNDIKLSPTLLSSVVSDEVVTLSKRIEDHQSASETLASLQDLTTQHETRKDNTQEAEQFDKRRSSLSTLVASRKNSLTDQTDDLGEVEKSETLPSSPSTRYHTSIADSNDEKSKSVELIEILQSTVPSDEIVMPSKHAEDRNEAIKMVPAQNTMTQHETSENERKEGEQYKERKSSESSISSDKESLINQIKKNGVNDAEPAILSKSILSISDTESPDKSKDGQKNIKLYSALESPVVSSEIEIPIQKIEDSNDDSKTVIAQQDTALVQKESSSINEDEKDQCNKRVTSPALSVSSETKSPILSQETTSVSKHTEDGKNSTETAVISPHTVIQTESLSTNEDEKQRSDNELISPTFSVCGEKDSSPDDVGASETSKKPSLSPSQQSDTDIADSNKDGSKIIEPFPESKSTGPSDQTVKASMHAEEHTDDTESTVSPKDTTSQHETLKDMESRHSMERQSLLSLVSDENDRLINQPDKIDDTEKSKTISLSPSSRSPTNIADSHEDKSKDVKLSPTLPSSVVSDGTVKASMDAEDHRDTIESTVSIPDATTQDKTSTDDKKENEQYDERRSSLSTSVPSRKGSSTYQTDDLGDIEKSETFSVLTLHSGELLDGTKSIGQDIESKKDATDTVESQKSLTIEKKSLADDKNEIEKYETGLTSRLPILSSDKKSLIDQINDSGSEALLTSTLLSSSTTEAGDHSDESKDVKLFSSLASSVIPDRTQNLSQQIEDKKDNLTNISSSQTTTLTEKEFAKSNIDTEEHDYKNLTTPTSSKKDISDHSESGIPQVDIMPIKKLSLIDDEVNILQKNKPLSSPMSSDLTLENKMKNQTSDFAQDIHFTSLHSVKTGIKDGADNLSEQNMPRPLELTLSNIKDTVVDRADKKDDIIKLSSSSIGTPPSMKIEISGSDSDKIHETESSMTQESIKLDKKESLVDDLENVQDNVESLTSTTPSLVRKESLINDGINIISSFSIEVDSKISSPQEIETLSKVGLSKTTIADDNQSSEQQKKRDEKSLLNQDKLRSSHDDEYGITMPSETNNLKDIHDKSTSQSHQNIELDRSNDESEAMLVKKKDIEKYIMNEYVERRKIIVSEVLEEIMNLYDVSKDIIIEIIEAICYEKNIDKKSIFDNGENIKFDISYRVTKRDIQSSTLPMDKKLDIENYIIREYVKPQKKITLKIIQEISTTKGVSNNDILAIVENLIAEQKLEREFLIENVEKDESSYEEKLSEHLSGKSTPECKSFECLTSQALVDDDKYESQFQKSFPRDLTEMRTTHITTFIHKSSSGPSTQIDLPDSFSRSLVTDLDIKNTENCFISGGKIIVETTTIEHKSEPVEMIYDNSLKEQNVIVKDEISIIKPIPENQTTIDTTDVKSDSIEQEKKDGEEKKTFDSNKESELKKEEIHEVDEIKQKESKDIAQSYKHHLGMLISGEKSGRSTPEKKDGLENRSRTSTPEGFRSEEVIKTTITTTRTISDEGEIITTTKEVTETTNEHGEVIVLAEKVDVTVADQGPSVNESASVESAHSLDLQKSSTSCSDVTSHDQTVTDISHKTGERQLDSENKTPGSPASMTSQVYHFEIQSEPVEFSTADMSSSFYGHLPSIPPSSQGDSSIKLVSSTETGDFTFKKLTESDTQNGKPNLKQDTDVEKSDDEFVRTGEIDEEKKDPLKDWGTPMKLPPPERPDRFNFRNSALLRAANISLNSPEFDLFHDWGKPMELPSPAPVCNESSDKTLSSTPKKDVKQPKKIISESLKNKKRSESPSKSNKKSKEVKNKIQPVYLDLTFVPHHGNSYYTSLEFFKRIRARYYVFSGTEPSREVYDALLNAKKTWENKDLEVTIIPTYDTDTLGYWVADNEEALAENHIDLSPSASRCTINLQDHETSCSAYRLEF